MLRIGNLTKISQAHKDKKVGLNLFTYLNNKKMRLTIFILLLQILPISKIYSQNNGLLKNETITTYWGSNEKQIRSVGTYQTSGY